MNNIKSIIILFAFISCLSCNDSGKKLYVGVVSAPMGFGQYHSVNDITSNSQDSSHYHPFWYENNYSILSTEKKNITLYSNGKIHTYKLMNDSVFVYENTTFTFKAENDIAKVSTDKEGTIYFKELNKNKIGESPHLSIDSFYNHIWSINLNDSITYEFNFYEYDSYRKAHKTIVKEISKGKQTPYIYLTLGNLSNSKDFDILTLGGGGKSPLSKDIVAIISEKENKLEIQGSVYSNYGFDPYYLNVSPQSISKDINISELKKPNLSGNWHNNITTTNSSEKNLNLKLDLKLNDNKTFTLKSNILSEDLNEAIKKEGTWDIDKTNWAIILSWDFIADFKTKKTITKELYLPIINDKPHINNSTLQNMWIENQTIKKSLFFYDLPVLKLSKSK